MDSDSVFPSTRREALALLYVQSRDLSEATPEDIAVLYDDAYRRIGPKLNELWRKNPEINTYY